VVRVTFALSAILEPEVNGGAGFRRDIAIRPRPISFAAAVLFFLLSLGLLSTPSAAETNLTWGKPSEMTGIDPQFSGDGTSWTVFYFVYERLFTTTDDLKPVGQLAESWDRISPTEYAFKLRRNAAFSNGRPLVASDVVGSFKRLKDPARGAVWGRQLKAVKDVIAIDDHTVRFELSEPLTPLLAILAVSPTAIMPMKEIENGSFDPEKDMLGSGPFMVSQHKQDESWAFERNPHYWRQGQPIADRFVIRIMPDDAARIAALREGRIDFATFENPDTERLVKDVPNVEVFVQKTPNFFRLDVSGLQETSVLRDDRVRAAVNYAIDRDQIVKIVFGGHSNVEYPVPAAFGKSACRDHSSVALPRAQRLEQARALVKQAGAENAPVSIIASPVLVTYPLIAQVLQRNLREIGLKSEIQQLPVAEWYKRVFGPQTDFNLSMSWFAGYSDPSIVLNWWVPNFAGWNVGFLKPMEGYASLVDQIRSEPDGPKRDDLMAQACKLVQDGANILALVNKPDYVVYRKDRLTPRFSNVEGNFDTLKYIGEFKRLP
jgi:peptide/nickel transport system substrate-binding protein